MDLRSLGYRTDLIFPAFDGQIMDRGDYLVIRTPSNPTYYWGNFLLFSQPPREGDFEKWRRLFASEIGSPPGVEHQAYGWDSPEGVLGLIEPFEQAGFSISRDIVLTSSSLKPPVQPSSLISVRPLNSPSDWEQVLELQMLTRDPAHGEAAFRQFRRRAMDRYHRMQQAGLGHWYGAFIGDRPVADLGLFHDGHGLGRYQSVATHPDFRRQGIAGRMVFEAGRQALAEHHLHTLVIIAESDSAPSRLYESVGFAPTERSVGMVWWDRKSDHS